MNQHIQKQIIKDLKDKIVGKHCRCCDLSKHYYDNELEAFLKTSLERVWKDAEQEGFSKGYEEGEKFANKIDNAMPQLDKMQKTAEELIKSLKQTT